jgi:glucokinase
VYLTVSTGIGGGVVVEGRLLEGASGTAGEIGHTTIDRHGPICKCGNIGCLEALASGTAIARRFKEALEAGGPSRASASFAGREPTAEDVARAAQSGDRLALSVFTDAAEAIGFGVVNCIHIFNPEVVAIGGGVTKAGSLLFDPINRIVDRYALAVPRKAVRVVGAEFGDDVGLVGAAAVAWAEPSA